MKIAHRPHDALNRQHGLLNSDAEDEGAIGCTVLRTEVPRIFSRHWFEAETEPSLVLVFPEKRRKFDG